MKWNSFFLITAILLLQFSCSQPNKKAFADNDILATEGLSRHPSNIRYSQHARCRMDCRHIDETEVLNILHNGTINYKKSLLNADDCHKKYAVEGYEKNQHLRIVFAACGSDVTVVTCIDLGNEWDCHCPGDHY